MELIRYLNDTFLTREQLLARCAVDGALLDAYQRRRMMPQDCYRLRVTLACDSFFGAHGESAALDYYAQGHVAWLGLLPALAGPEEAQRVFAARYRATLAQLADTGTIVVDGELAGDAHIAAEWSHFLDGTYGLCTASGLPEDIAAKEAASAVIRVLTVHGPAHGLSDDERGRLRAAVEVLDRASAPFAPHERARSSRRRLVEDVRRMWCL